LVGDPLVISDDGVFVGCGRAEIRRVLSCSDSAEHRKDGDRTTVPDVRCLKSSLIRLAFASFEKRQAG
jgi:hypothetical protein